MTGRGGGGTPLHYTPPPSALPSTVLLSSPLTYGDISSGSLPLPCPLLSLSFSRTQSSHFRTAWSPLSAGRLLPTAHKEKVEQFQAVDKAELENLLHTGPSSHSAKDPRVIVAASVVCGRLLIKKCVLLEVLPLTLVFMRWHSPA